MPRVGRRCSGLNQGALSHDWQRSVTGLALGEGWVGFRSLPAGAWRARAGLQRSRDRGRRAPSPLAGGQAAARVSARARVWPSSAPISAGPAGETGLEARPSSPAAVTSSPSWGFALDIRTLQSRGKGRCLSQPRSSATIRAWEPEAGPRPWPALSGGSTDWCTGPARSPHREPGSPSPQSVAVAGEGSAGWGPGCHSKLTQTGARNPQKLMVHGPRGQTGRGRLPREL